MRLRLHRHLQRWVEAHQNGTFQHHRGPLTYWKQRLSTSTQRNVCYDIYVCTAVPSAAPSRNASWKSSAVSSLLSSHLRPYFTCCMQTKLRGRRGAGILTAVSACPPPCHCMSPPAANPLVLPVTFQQIPLVSVQPEVICSVLNHTQHSKHFQNDANWLRITSLMASFPLMIGHTCCVCSYI